MKPSQYVCRIKNTANRKLLRSISIILILKIRNRPIEENCLPQGCAASWWQRWDETSVLLTPSALQGDLAIPLYSWPRNLWHLGPRNLWHSINSANHRNDPCGSFRYIVSFLRGRGLIYNEWWVAIMPSRNKLVWKNLGTSSQEYLRPGIRLS